MRAYKETYLNKATRNFGSMIDYAVNDCLIDGSLFFHMFIASGLASRFERGDPKVIAGMSGVELAIEAIDLATGARPTEAPSERENRTQEYWAGWALAHYQWSTSMKFSAILRILPFPDIVKMYHALHEADITKFFAVVDEIRARENKYVNLKRIRRIAGLSQSQLAKEAGVSLRSIQMYEQRKKDINKAQAITLAKISRVLSCDVEDLLEVENSAPQLA